MEEVSEAYLPGIGKKFTLETQQGDRVVVVVHNEGKREIYHFEGEGESPGTIITLSDEEARRLSAILGGAYFRPKVVEELEIALEDLKIEWVKLPRGSSLVGKMLRESGVREKTGVSIIAIIRDSGAYPSPEPSKTLEEGDTLVVIGKREQAAKFREFIKWTAE